MTFVDLVPQIILPPPEDVQIMKKSYDGEPISTEEIFEWIRLIRDPEHPSMTLEDLKVVHIDNIRVNDQQNFVEVLFIPTTPNCSMGSIIGLAIKYLLMKILPTRFTTRVLCKEGTHETWSSLNKQINDKERVLAALSNDNIMKVVSKSVDVCYYFE